MKKTIIEGIHNILKDPKCSGNIRCLMWCSVITCIYFSILVYGFLLMDITIETINPISQKVYSFKNKYNEHTHPETNVYTTGTPKIKVELNE